MAPEVVSVPTQGIERWLSHASLPDLGATPGRARRRVRQHRLPVSGHGGLRRPRPGDGHDPKADPWLPERAVWPLLEVVEEHFDDPWLAPLAEHIRNSSPRTRPCRARRQTNRFSIVRHVADLFDRYAVHRPDMVQRWAAGRPGRDEAEWQVKLWRLLRRTHRPAEPGGAPGRRLPAAPRRARAPGLPASAVPVRADPAPASYLDVLDAIAAERDVHLFLLHPSPRLWQRLEVLVGPGPGTAPSGGPDGVGRREPSAASWGRDAREMQLVLGGAVTHGDWC